jgi:hypothetical protein
MTARSRQRLVIGVGQRAWITRDPAEHRRVVRRAAELLTGHMPAADESAAVTETRL